MFGGKWSEARVLTAILTIAFLMRLGCAWAVQWRLDHTTHELCLIPGDADGYWYLAGQITAGKNYEIYSPPRRVMRMPGFPALLAVARTLFGTNNVLAVRIWLAAWETAGCGFVYLLGKELCQATAGFWAALVVAVSPVQAIFSVMILSEATFATAITASLFLLVRLHHKLQQTPSTREVGLSLVAGLCLAAATYLRPTWLLSGPLSAVCLLCGQHIGRRLRAGLLLCVGLYAAMLPWGLRNWSVTGHFTMTTFWVGPSLYDGLNPEATGDSNMTFFDEENLLGEMSEYEMDQAYIRRAKQYAWEHPDRAVALMGIKLLRYWTPWPNAAQFQNPLVRIVVVISFLLLFVPAIYGTWLARRRWEVLLVTWGPILYFSAIHMLFVGSIRYRLPAEYPFAVLAGLGLAQWTTVGFASRWWLPSPREPA